MSLKTAWLNPEPPLKAKTPGYARTMENLHRMMERGVKASLIVDLQALPYGHEDRILHSLWVINSPNLTSQVSSTLSYNESDPSQPTLNSILTISYHP